MPRGIYDRSHLRKSSDKPKAKAESRTATRAKHTKRAVLAKAAPRRKPATLVQQIHDSITVVEKAKGLRQFYGVLDTVTEKHPQLVVFESIEEAVLFMRNAWGYDEKMIATEQDAKVLVFEAVTKPELRSVRLSYTLADEQQGSDTIQS
jgi:hypothetical protein